MHRDVLREGTHAAEVERVLLGKRQVVEDHQDEDMHPAEAGVHIRLLVEEHIPELLLVGTPGVVGNLEKWYQSND